MSENLRLVTSPSVRCDGSGKPARTDGSCDRCGAPSVGGEYVPPSREAWSAFFGQVPGRFSAHAPIGHQIAREHDRVQER